jgi:glyoxylase-like metal-dependent hydrolase (beta-lactamase superfamily II)
MELLQIHGPYAFNDWRVTRIVEWEGEAMPHAVLFPKISADEIRAASPAGAGGRLTERGMIVTSNQFFLLEGEGRAAVIEAGSGNGKRRPAEPYWDRQNLPYFETLGSLGIKPEDVEFVFLSHLHQDHVGLATIWKDGSWTPAFPRAKYVVHPREWAHWTGLSPDDPRYHPCIGDSILPLREAGCVLFARGGDRIGGIRIHEAPGHTPGLLLFEAAQGALWFLGDLLHHPAQAAHPEWPSADFDTDRAGGIAQRRRYFARFADSGACLLASHAGGPFRIESNGPGKFFFRPLPEGPAEDRQSLSEIRIPESELPENPASGIAGE